MGFSETTYFHEVKKAMVQYNPAYRNQAKPRSSQKPKSRETSLARIKPSPTLLRVQQLNAFIVQKPEGTRAPPLNQAVLQNLPAAGVSTNEQGRHRIVWDFTVLLPLTDSPAACLSPRPATSHQKSYSRVVQSLAGRIFHLSFPC